MDRLSRVYAWSAGATIFSLFVFGPAVAGILTIALIVLIVCTLR